MIFYSFLPDWVKLIQMKFEERLTLTQYFTKTYCSYLNFERCIKILIKFPLIWCIVGLCRSKFDLIFKGLNEWLILDEKVTGQKGSGRFPAKPVGRSLHVLQLCFAYSSRKKLPVGID